MSKPEFWPAAVSAHPRIGFLIGMGAAVTRRPLPHHRTYGSVHGGSNWPTLTGKPSYHKHCQSGARTGSGYESPAAGGSAKASFQAAAAPAPFTLSSPVPDVNFTRVVDNESAQHTQAPAQESRDEFARLFKSGPMEPVKPSAAERDPTPQNPAPAHAGPASTMSADDPFAALFKKTGAVSPAD